MEDIQQSGNEKPETLNSVTITGKKKSSDKTTEISYSYKVYFDSSNQTKAFADVALAEKLVAGRTNENATTSYEPVNPREVRTI
jgi:hypothetical protein